jgi:serine phosphatase RsbU (regulator of sigma subunit)
VGSLKVISRYLPAESAQVLAGDFYGAVEQPGGSVAIMVGDVAGHGPAAAALATRLRAMWRGLAIAGVSDVDTVRALNETLLAEQDRISSPIPFATVCLASVSAERGSAQVLVAGHPPPMMVTHAGAVDCELPPGPALGVSLESAWTDHTIELPGSDWSLMLYTDGLVEGRSWPNGPRPFGSERLLPLLAARQTPLDDTDVDAVLAEVLEANGGPWLDDVVVLAVSRQDAGDSHDVAEASSLTAPRPG